MTNVSLNLTGIYGGGAGLHHSSYSPPGLGLLWPFLPSRYNSKYWCSSLRSCVESQSTCEHNGKTYSKKSSSSVSQSLSSHLEAELDLSLHGIVKPRGIVGCWTKQHPIKGFHILLRLLSSLPLKGIRVWNILFLCAWLPLDGNPGMGHDQIFLLLSLASPSL